MNRVKMRMVLHSEPNEPLLEWNFKANSMFEAVHKGKKICEDNNKRWPEDVIVWDN